MVNSKKISLIDKLEGEHRISNVYGSCLEVLRKLPTCSFCFRGYKDKNTLCRCIQGSKRRNNLQKRYLQIKKEEAAHESPISSLKCKKHWTCDVFREWNKSSKVRLIYLHVLKCRPRCGWQFFKLTRRIKCAGVAFWG